MVKKIFFVISLFFLFSCEDDTPQEAKTPAKEDKTPLLDTVVTTEKETSIAADEDLKINLAFNDSDAKNLFIIDSVPLFSTYKKVKTFFPTITKSAKNDNLAATSFQIKGDKVIVQFQFLKDSLQSINYMVVKKDNKVADTYFKGIRNFYSKKLGQFERESIEEESRFSPSFYFEFKNTQLTIYNNINDGTVSWIFEKQYL